MSCDEKEFKDGAELKKWTVNVFDRLNQSHSKIESKLIGAHNTTNLCMKSFGILLAIGGIICACAPAKSISSDSDSFFTSMFGIVAFLIGIKVLYDSRKPNSWLYRKFLNCTYRDHQDDSTGNSYLWPGGDLKEEEKKFIQDSISDYHLLDIRDDRIKVSTQQQDYADLSMQLLTASSDKEKYLEEAQNRGDIFLKNVNEYKFFKNNPPAPILKTILEYMGCQDDQILLKKYGYLKK